MSDLAIRIENISKKYRLGVIGSGTFFRDLQSWIALKRGKEDPHSKIGETKYAVGKHHFWALKDVSFDVKKGERIGILGQNGAGKSTLLKIISRITAPTEGTVKIRGRVASLLEIGTGFHPELTGRENIHLAGAVRGMKRKKINQQLDQIIEFSGIESYYIDTPIKRYSSGMSVRLGFSIAAHLEGDILITDEVLAVGDAEFRKRALKKMRGLSLDEGRTVLFVSHSMEQVKELCTGGVVMEKGQIKYMSPDNIHDVIDSYLPMTGNSTPCWENDGSVGDRNFTPLKMYLADGANNPLESVENKTDVYVAIEAEVLEADNAFNAYITLSTDSGGIIFQSRMRDYNSPALSVGKNEFYIKLPLGDLNAGDYKVLLNAHLDHGAEKKAIIPSGKSPEISFSIASAFVPEFGLLKRPGVLAPRLEWKKNMGHL